MNTKKIVTLVFCLLFAATAAWAHKPLLSVEDNEDGTIYIEVGFSDGGSGSGHTIRIKDKATGKVLTETKVPGESSMDLPMPKAPYLVEFYAGPGHSIEQEGPFSEQATDKATGETPAAAPVAAAPQPTASAPVTATPTPVAPVVVASAAPAGPGMAMAMKMMLTTQIVTAVLLAFLLGTIIFWIGYTFGKTNATTKR